MDRAPLGQAGDAQLQPINIEMFLEDPQKSVVFAPPEAAVKLNNPFYEATQLEQDGKRDQAKAIYLELLNANFDNAVLCAALGMSYATTMRSGLAKLLLETALRGLDAGRLIDDFKALGIVPKCQHPNDIDKFLSGKRAEILNALGTCYKHENLVPQARDLFEQAQSIVPPNADIQNNLGTLYINEGCPEQALATLTKAIEIQPNHAQAHWNRSLAWLEMGDYVQGWPEYDFGFAAHVRNERSHTKTPVPNWDGTPGKRLVVYGEQGIGDEILFASMLPDLLRDCPNTIFECHRKLHTLFAASFPNIDIYPTREDPMITWPLKPDGTPRYDFEAKVALGSLGRYYRNHLEDFPGTPFLQPTAAAEKTWGERLHALGDKPKIGISWIGGHKRTRMEVRSIELARLRPLLELGRDKVDWISLQYTPAEDELAAFEKETGIHIHHWPENVYNANYDETAGLVAGLDLVISVATSVIHLCGALGVPCWVMTASRAAWREYYGGDHMTWYGNNNTMFRQAPGSTDWEPVIAEVTAALADMLGAIDGNPSSP